MSTVLVVPTHGLGASLVKTYAADTNNRVFAASRVSVLPENTQNITYIPNIPDLESAHPHAGSDLVDFLSARNVSHLDVVIIVVSYVVYESPEGPSHFAQERNKARAIGPTKLISALANKDDKILNSKSKVIFVSSQIASVTLRHKPEGGANYGHRDFKAALNMSAKLLSLDLKDRDIAIATVHTGFTRTEKPCSVDFRKFCDNGVSVTVVPDVAAQSVVEWIDTFDICKTGQYWDSRALGGPGTEEPVLSPKDELSTPLPLPG